jgi:hypothetical protein
MSDIDFQNGFVCGMATKGMIKTGSQYEPLVWNDEGIYSYFYIDFKRAVSKFSTGMVAESLVVHDSVQLTITGFDKISDSVYKLYVNIAGKFNGITVINKASTYLTFTDGSKVTPFSVMFYVAGLAKYERIPYMYDSADFESTTLTLTSIVESNTFDLWDNLDEFIVSDTVTFANSLATFTTNETTTITLT